MQWLTSGFHGYHRMQRLISGYHGMQRLISCFHGMQRLISGYHGFHEMQRLISGFHGYHGMQRLISGFHGYNYTPFSPHPWEPLLSNQKFTVHQPQSPKLKEQKLFSTYSWLRSSSRGEYALELGFPFLFREGWILVILKHM